VKEVRERRKGQEEQRLPIFMSCQELLNDSITRATHHAKSISIFCELLRDWESKRERTLALSSIIRLSVQVLSWIERVLL
jgi:hypothetical protein